MVLVDPVFLILFVVVTAVLTIYFRLLINLNPSSEPKLTSYMTKAVERKTRKPSKTTRSVTPVETLPEKGTGNTLPKEEASDSFPKGESGERECPHYIGYLTTLPKRSRFPDECFGCRNVIQCLRIEPTKVIESFYVTAPQSE